MSKLFLQGYAVRILLEASMVSSDPLDNTRYYKLEASIDGSNTPCRYSAKNDKGVIQTWNPVLGVRMLETQETLSSDQSSTLAFNGGADLAESIITRVRSMDRLRIEITNGSGWCLAFDGFVSSFSKRLMSSPEHYGNEVAISANGLWKFLTQSWFNWQGAIRDVSSIVKPGEAGESLFNTLNKNHSMPGQEIIKLFITTALSLVELKTGEGLIQPGNFFDFGTGKDWTNAFGLAYPMPGKTLPNYRGPLVGLVQTVAEPDIHECFCTYRKVGGRERPVIIHRPKPFPGAVGDDDGWKALTVHIIQNEPSAKTTMSSKNDAHHPNSFHWAQGSSTDSGWSEYMQKLMHGIIVDTRSIKRYGYSARPVAPGLPPLTNVPKDSRGKFVDVVQLIMKRIAYQEAPLPELWSRSVQIPLRPGIHPGEVVEEYSLGRAWTGYVSTVHHRISADPWSGMTTIGLVRCLPCTAKEYPDMVRALVNIETMPYIVPPISGSADLDQTGGSRKHPIDINNPAFQKVGGVPWGKGVQDAAKARGIPPWVLAHALHIESSFGTDPRAENKGGLMQFTRVTANDLNHQGYDKPFSFEIAKADPERSLDAAAWYLAKIRRQVDSAMPMTYADDYRWSWTLYGYNMGPTAAITNGTAQKWQFSTADKALDQYRIYWGPGPVQQARAQFGGVL